MSLEPTQSSEPFRLTYNPVQRPDRTPSRMERVYLAAKGRWDNRPDMLELQLKYLLYAPFALAGAGLALSVVDGTFQTHIAERMSEVRVNPHDNQIEQQLQDLVRNIGKAGVQSEQ